MITCRNILIFVRLMFFFALLMIAGGVFCLGSSFFDFMSKIGFWTEICFVLVVVVEGAEILFVTEWIIYFLLLLCFKLLFVKTKFVRVKVNNIKDWSSFCKFISSTVNEAEQLRWPTSWNSAWKSILDLGEK